MQLTGIRFSDSEFCSSRIVYAVLLDKHAYQTTNGRRGSAQILGFRIYPMEKFSSFFVKFLPDLEEKTCLHPIFLADSEYSKLDFVGTHSTTNNDKEIFAQCYFELLCCRWEKFCKTSS